MSCYNCGRTFRSRVEQNPLLRSCESCFHANCLLCGMSSHFPGSCATAAIIRENDLPWSEYGPPFDDFESLEDEIDDLFSSFVDGPLFIAYEYYERLMLQLTCEQMLGAVKFLLWLYTLDVNDPGLNAVLEQSEVVHERLLEVIDHFPNPQTPLLQWTAVLPFRDLLAQSFIQLLMLMMGYYGVLGTPLPQVVPGLPQLPLNLPQGIVNDVIMTIFNGEEIALTTQQLSAAREEDFQFDFELDDEDWDVDHLPPALDANEVAGFVYPFYAEAFLWVFPQVERC